MDRIGSALRNYIILSVTYIGLILSLPANTADLDRYSLSASQYRSLRFLLAIPLVLVWFGAFYGYAKIEEYAKTLAKTSEAQGYAQLAVGCRWLAWGLSIPALSALILNSLFSSDSRIHTSFMIFNN